MNKNIIKNGKTTQMTRVCFKRYEYAMNIISVLLICICVIGCSKKELMSISDIKFIKNSDHTTQSFEEKDWAQYQSYLSQAEKLEKLQFVKVKPGAHTFDSGKIFKYVYSERTELGEAVLGRLSDKNINLPNDIEHQIVRLENDIENKLGITVLEYILFVYSTSGSIGGPGDSVYTDNQDTVDILKSLSKKGYIEWSIEEDTFNGEDSISLHWHGTKKGREALFLLNSES